MDSKPKGFRDAIDELERESESNGHGGTDFRHRLEQELHRIEEALKELKPKIEDTKSKVEQEVQKNPWAAIGIVALVFFILGLLFSPRGRSRD